MRTQIRQHQSTVRSFLLELPADLRSTINERVFSLDYISSFLGIFFMKGSSRGVREGGGRGGEREGGEDDFLTSERNPRPYSPSCEPPAPQRKREGHPRAPR